MTNPPRLRDGQLVVDDRPVLILGGELHNSSSSTSRWMTDRWSGIVDAGCTTVLAAVTWEQLEPAEGRFDMTSVDDLLTGARAHGLRLVLLWFGSWKNGGSTYVPPWVKADRERFGVQLLGGRPSSTLSPFVAANAEADARAFGRLMAHLREKDGPTRTVLMVQVENEIGSLGDSRDRSPAAERAWTSPVPEALLSHLRDDPDGCAAQLRAPLDPDAGPTPTWPQAFGEGERADELFMAWHLAGYVDRVAGAGRAELDVPMYVNAWLDAGGEGGAVNLAGGNQPGHYPSGGPLPHVAAAWHAAAPTIDFLAPDIYAGDPGTWLDRYRAVTPTVFVPELHRSEPGMETIFLAIGEHGAIGTAPFGIDELQEDERPRLRRVYRQLGAIADDILDAQAAGTIRGFAVGPARSAELPMGDYVLTASMGFDARAQVGYGLVLALGANEFVAAGSAFLLFAKTADGEPARIGQVHELAIEDPTGRAADLPVLRWLNGDETLSGRGINVTGEVVEPWPNGIPASASSTGLVRFTLLGQ